MSDLHLREILLHLHSRLTDNNQEQLHFYLQNEVPRPLVDDCSSSGTLKLIQSLFDQDKINEGNVTLLIAAFEKIRCSDVAHHLKAKFRKQKGTLLGLDKAKNRLIPPYFGPLTPDLQCKPGGNYVLGYATGKAAGRITQLQFVWYIFES